MRLFLICILILWNCEGPSKPEMLPVPEEKKEIPLEQIQEELNSENPQVRAQAILGIPNELFKPYLGKIRNLLKNDVSPAVKGTAAIALGTWKDRVSIPEIIKLFSKDSGVTPEILLEALARMGDPSCANAILPFLQSQNHTLRLIAVDTLVRIGANSAGKTILNLARKNQDPKIAKTYAMALGKLKVHSAESYLIELAKTVEPSPTLAATYLALGRISSKKSIPILVRGLSGDFDKGSENSMIALIEIKSSTAIASTIPILKHKNRDIRYRAVNVLSEIPSSETGPKVLKILEENEPNSVAPAALVLGRIGFKSARLSIEKSFINSQLPDREMIGRSLGYLGDKKSIPVLLNVLKEPEGEGRYGAAWSLGILQAMEVLDDLIAASKSKDPKLSLLAVEALGFLGSPKALSTLAELAEKNPDSSSIVVSAIASIPGEESRKILENFAQKKNISLQQAAISGLGERKERDSVPVLIKILDENEEVSFKLLMFSLSSITGKNFHSRNEWLNWYKLNSK